MGLCLKMKKNLYLVLIIFCVCLGACQSQNIEANPYDTYPPKINDQMKAPSILIFSKTREWRHEKGIAGGNLFFIKLAEKLGYGFLTTQNGAIFNESDLAKFDVVVLNSFTGDALSPKQEVAFQNWVEAGGGVISVHGSGDASHQDWAWYQDNVLGTVFISHPMAPQFQTADVHTLFPAHPVMAGIDKIWSHNDEWYTFDGVPNKEFTILAGLDEASYSPVNTVYGVEDLRMGPKPSDHPIICSRCLGEGRSVYSALGHLDTAFQAQDHARLLENAVNWVSKTTDPEGVYCDSKPTD